MVIAMFWLSISASAFDFKVDGIAYTITSFSDLTCSVAASDETYEGEITVPSEVKFNGKTLTVTSISDSAFKNSLITSVLIPSTVIDIEASAFANCENLCSIVLLEGLQSIGDDAFNGCVNLTKIDFPTSLKTIGSAGFANCKSLSQIALSTGITNLGASAFENCENATTVSLGSISVLEEKVFNSCKELKEIEWSDNLYQIKDRAFANCGFTKFIIPNKVTTIGKNILGSNMNLESFTIGNGISEIEADPIAGCPKVSEFIIADGGNPLTLKFSSGYPSKVAPEVEHCYIISGGYRNSTFEKVYIGRPLLNYSYYIQFERYTVSYYILPPFNGNKNIKYITFGPNVSSVDSRTLYLSGKYYCYGWLEGCSNIEKLTILGLTDIPKHFAKDVMSLKTIELPNTTLSVKEEAFYNCASLETIIFGSKLSNIERDAFEKCNSLSSIYSKAVLPPTYSTGFNKDIYLNCRLNIPLETEQSYRSTSPWNNFWNISESQECVSEFEIGGLIYSVTSGNNVIVSGNKLADECGIVIPSRVEYYSSDYDVIGIGESAFKGASINSIVIPGCVSNIYNDAFNSCSNLKNIMMDYSDKAVIIGHKSYLQLSNSITPYPNAITVDEKRTGFRNGYYDGLFYGLPIEHLVINRDIELPKYYERTRGGSTSSFSTVYNDIVYYPPFYGLTNLKYLEIGDNVSSICKNQIEAVVNAVPTTMEYTNFGKCDNIEVVVSNNPNAPIGGGFSQTVYENASLFLPNGGFDSYRSDDYWKKFAHINEASLIPIESISFESDEVVIDVNESKKLNPIIGPSEASIQNLKWSSSNASIVNVSDDGVITSSSREGEATITAIACDGSRVSTSVKVIVQEGAGLSDVLPDNNIAISVEKGKLCIRGKSDTDVVSVYNVQGQLIISTNYNWIDLDSKGIYIVQVNSISKKVII